MKNPQENTPINPEQVPKEVYNIYNDYAHSRIDRKEFMEKLSVFAIGGLTVSSLTSFLTPNYDDKIQIKKGDPRITEEVVEYTSPKGGGKIKGLLCKPKNLNGKVGGVVVVHENRGLNPHIEDVARRAALAGFLALAPDALSPLGGYPGNDDDGRTLQSQRNRDEMLEDFIAAGEYLLKREENNGKLGVVGFCFGGWVSNMMAARMPNLSASVPYYGGQAVLEWVPQIKAPLQLHYAENDERVNAGWPPYEEELKKHQKTYEVYFYPGTHHGFHNDTTPRFDPEAAQLSWERTLAFFNKHLSTP